MRICFIGDSFVTGSYDVECRGWVGRLCADARERGHDVSCYNLGVRGETSAQIARRWRAEAESRQAAQQEGRLVFEFGVNDARVVNGKAQMTPEDSFANAKKMLADAIAWKKTLMVGPPPGGDADRNDRVKVLSAGFARICGELNIPYFDSYSALLETPGFVRSTLSIDGTHPAADGYAEWAKQVDAWPAWRAWYP